MPNKLRNPQAHHWEGPNQHRGADLRTLSKPEPPQGAMSVENRTQAEKASSRRYTLVDVLDPENLALAWQRVKANKGAAGIDGMEVLRRLRIVSGRSRSGGGGDSADAARYGNRCLHRWR